jgi:signal transduction histidine kinase
MGERRHCELVALISDEVDRAREQAPQLDLSLRVDPSVPPTAEISIDAVSEGLSNLLDNARRHAARAIQVSAAGDGGDLVIEVRDDGAGVPDGAEDQVFERFVSLDGRGGPGLGLPIARGLAEREGGTLVFERGAFVLRVPIVVGGADQPMGPSTRSV